MKIGLTSVFVHDPIAAFKFYTEVLGFVKRMYMPEAWIAIVVSPEEPDGTGLLLEPNHNAIAKTYQKGLYKAGIPSHCFQCTQIFTQNMNGSKGEELYLKTHQKKLSMVLRRSSKTHAGI